MGRGRVDRDVTVNPGDAADVPEALIRAAVLRALDDGGIHTAEISVTLLDDPEIRAMNREYLEQDRATDVIAFDLGGDGRVMGDVYVGWRQAERQADELGIPRDEELARLALHGTLHVLGHDHPEGPRRTESAMFVLQERLLAEVLTGR